MGRVNASLPTSATSFAFFLTLEREINQQNQNCSNTQNNGNAYLIEFGTKGIKTRLTKSMKFQVLLNGILGLSNNNNNNNDIVCNISEHKMDY